jgi:hypothetical protein
VQDHEPPLSLFFRNAFNVNERCDLQAVTTHKPKSDRSIAVTHRLSTFYNQQNEKQYEVETVSASEASEQAADMAMSVGVQVSYCNVYSEQ